jgi:hypothetical protein
MKIIKNKFSLFFPILTFAFLILSFSAQVANTAGAATESNLWKMQSGVSDIGEQAFGDSKPRDIREIAARSIKIFLSFLGIVFLVLLISAGWKYMKASGNQDEVSEAVNQIKTAIIGLIIVLSAYAITDYMTDCVLDITKPNSVWMCDRELTY